MDHELVEWRDGRDAAQGIGDFGLGSMRRRLGGRGRRARKHADPTKIDTAEKL